MKHLTSEAAGQEKHPTKQHDTAAHGHRAHRIPRGLQCLDTRHRADKQREQLGAAGTQDGGHRHPRTNVDLSRSSDGAGAPRQSFLIVWPARPSPMPPSSRAPQASLLVVYTDPVGKRPDLAMEAPDRP